MATRFERLAREIGLARVAKREHHFSVAPHRRKAILTQIRQALPAPERPVSDAFQNRGWRLPPQRSPAPWLESISLEDVSNLAQIRWYPTLFVAPNDCDDFVSVAWKFIHQNMIRHLI